MIPDKVSQPDIHTFLIAFGNEDHVDRQFSPYLSNCFQGVILGHFRPFGIGRASGNEHLLELTLLYDGRIKWGYAPYIRLRYRHGVVLPVDDDRLGSAVIALGVDNGIAG